MAKGRDKRVNAREAIAQNLRRHRRRLGISQEQLASLSGLHRNYVGSVERGERNISIDNIEKLATAIGIAVPALLSPPRGKER